MVTIDNYSPQAKSLWSLWFLECIFFKLKYHWYSVSWWFHIHKTVVQRSCILSSPHPLYCCHCLSACKMLESHYLSSLCCIAFPVTFLMGMVFLSPFFSISLLFWLSCLQKWLLNQFIILLRIWHSLSQDLSLYCTSLLKEHVQNNTVNRIFKSFV